ncbi:hypothetical protein SEA_REDWATTLEHOG_210 [Gordonia phage RedWattleHog]|uniref:Uncharacterized protein n=1 Tax=Gordonia phage Stormageddon TaxID=2656541 RepID=A0A649VS48_9CAUD|nr:hypothetical protein KHQ86_gp089 [Gordonia phage Stormageddon]QGJ95071.1 hypothetical protein SEA_STORMAGEDDON_211 [Gordonia phage Stormageddon]QLF83713.1 hypothetical protein SEA_REDWATTLEHOG_210 [Gordonia phage RedWattleHog]
MSNKQMHGVWLSTESFTSGEGPALAGEATWDEVLESIKSSEHTANLRAVFVATLVSESWVPLSFARPASGKSNAISDVQARKYLAAREKARGSGPESAPEPAPAAQPVESAPQQAEGEIVLRLAPHVAEVLRDAFNLIASGRPVVIQTVEQPSQ